MVNIVFAISTLSERLCNLLLSVHAHNIDIDPNYLIFVSDNRIYTPYLYYNTYLDDKKLCFRDFVRVVK